jgi:hypothetical protein
MRKTLLTTAAALSLAGLLAACDRSPQAADGATAQGDPGTAMAPGTVGGADTGRDTGAGGEAGGAGELGAPAATGSLGPGSTGANANDAGASGAANATTDTPMGGGTTTQP